MVGNFQPLIDSLPITNSDGTPTQYFIRWAQERQLDIGGAITSEQAQALIDSWAVARKVLTGNGLQGGGPLSTDLTLSVKNGTGLNFDGTGNLKLADTAVSTGTYGDATHVAQITVDQQGRLTAVANVAVTGGGSGTPLYNLSAGVPAASSFTTFNFTNATLSEVSGKAVWISMTSAASGGGIHGAYRTAPATPYRVAMLLHNAIPGNDSWVPCGWRRSSDGKLQLTIMNQGNYAIQSFDSPTSFNSQQVGNTSLNAGFTYWLGFRDDGTTVYFEFSMDGVNWLTLYSVAKSSGFLGSSGYNQVFFAARQNNGLPSLITCRCWDENGLSRTFP